MYSACMVHVRCILEILYSVNRLLCSIVGCWNLLYVIGSSSKLSNHFIISWCIGWNIHYCYWYCILCCIIIWKDHKVVVQIYQGQPSYSSLYYIVNLFFLTRIYCVNIHYQELEFVGVHYFWEDLKVVNTLRVNRQHHMLLFISEIICVKYQNYWNQKIISLLGGSNLQFFFLTRSFIEAFVTGSNKFFGLCSESTPGVYIQSFHQEVSLVGILT